MEIVFWRLTKKVSRGGGLEWDNVCVVWWSGGITMLPPVSQVQHARRLEDSWVCVVLSDGLYVRSEKILNIEFWTSLGVWHVIIKLCTHYMFIDRLLKYRTRAPLGGLGGGFSPSTFLLSNRFLFWDQDKPLSRKRVYSKHKSIQSLRISCFEN